MKKIVFLLFASFSLLVSAQNSSKSYQKLWEKVYKDEVNLLPKSALEKVNAIYKRAEKRRDQQQLIRCLLYKSKFAITLEEDAQLKVVRDFKSAIAKAKKKEDKAVLHNMLGHMYWDYYNKYRWGNRRTKTANKDIGDDFRKWDLDRLVKEIQKQFESSLQYASVTQKISKEKYKELIDLEEAITVYTPTLYDVLAHNALAFYKDSRAELNQPKEPFLIDDVNYAKRLETVELKTKDTTSQKYLTLKTYQSLLQFHQKEKNKEAYLKVLFQSMDYVLGRSVFDNEEEVRLAVLKDLIQQYSLKNETALIYFELANAYFDRDEKVMALDYCEKIIKNTPEARIAQKTKDLKEVILRKKLDCRLEEYMPVDTYAKALLTYRNTSSVDFSVVKLNSDNEKKIEEGETRKERQAALDSLPKLKTWTVQLPDLKDYKEHTTEMALPKLMQGNYILIGKVKGEDYYYQRFQVTNLTLLKKPNGVFQVLNRWNGKPINNAKVNFKKEKNYRRDRAINKNFKTDELGEFVYKSKDYFSGVQATVTTATDSATFDIRLNGYRKPNNERLDWESSAFVFTDRSIYRPGQTVHVKIHLIEKKGIAVRIPQDDAIVEIGLYDKNEQEIAKKEVQINEFGTAATRFKLPLTGLMGQYRFKVIKGSKWLYPRNRISVEEYKRPKFETDFNPVTGVYKVNDSVKVTGTATALAGSKITGAKVSYRVVRKARYPRWCWWIPQPISSNQEIDHGETITDGEGNYTVPFKAVPDRSVDKKNQPVFYYTIYADVTDINGETRSTETEVKVGYHSLKLSVTTANKIDVKDKEQEIHITTENLNGQFVAASGMVKIYKLIAPSHPQKKRLWKKPEINIIEDEDYQKWFPNEVFDDVANPEKWKKGTLVYQQSFDTQKEKTVLLKKFSKWKTGKYIVIVESKDPWGQAVKDEKVFTFIDREAKQVADHKLFELYVDKESYQPKDTVVLSVGSALKDMRVFVEIEKKHQTISKHQIYLSDGIKKIKIPVNEADRGGFAIKWHWVSLNTSDYGVKHVSVPHHPVDLHIETLTFRNKLEPGAKQKWAFKIKGAQKEKVTAEVLASMYDVSLDQFMPHKWTYKPITQPIYSTHYFIDAGYGFKTQTIALVKKSWQYFSYTHGISKEPFKWFGFSITNDKWKNRSYLRSIEYVKSSYKKLKDSSVPKGKVKITLIDAKLKDPLAFASIYNKSNPKKGTTTDFGGIARIDAKKGDLLVVEFVGYKPFTFKVDKKYNHYIVKISPVEDALDAVVLVGYGTQKKKEVTGAVAQVEADDLEEIVTDDLDSALQGRVAGVAIRGSSSIGGNNQPLYVIDGVLFDGTTDSISENPISEIHPDDIETMEVLKGEAAISLYGAKGTNGVVLITTKAGIKKQEQALAKVKARTNFNETAFFFPQLRTNQKGEVSFEFTMPEDLTRWKLQLLAHTKQLHTGYKSLTTVTQKQLMVIPNVPRFLREGDVITLSTKISNLGDEFQQGRVKLELTDPTTGKNIDALLQNHKASQSFTVAKKGNTSVSWELQIPENVSAVQYKIVAASNQFSDGEQNVLPVLSNRMLVTETLPLWVNGGQTKTFTLDGLKNNESKTLKHHQVSLEITSNPAWYAVQALPYLMEYPYECAEQTFARYYANQLASHIAHANPKIKKVFDAWSTAKDGNAMVSNLEKNPELKSIIIQETPWLRDAQSETEQKKRIALLFNLNKMEMGLNSAVKKLGEIQLSNGGFPWFKGGDYANPYITLHIVQGYEHLKRLGVEVETSGESKKLKRIINKAKEFLEEELEDRYRDLLERAEKIKREADSKEEGIRDSQKYLARKHLYSFELQYLYVLSFEPTKKLGRDLQEAVAYYTNQAAAFWKGETLYNKGLLALIHHRNGEKELTESIVKSLKENSVVSQEMGRYWKENVPSWFWYKDPIVTQSLLIEMFSEVEDNTLFVDELKQWLLKNKQVQQWKTTKATTEAVYALLLQGSDWLSVDEAVDVKIGGKPIPAQKMKEVTVEAGTGYFKTNWKANEVTNDLGTVSLAKKEKGVAWGALYWQYFEDLDKIKSAETPLSLRKEVFVKKNTDSGPTLIPIDGKTVLKVGDLLTVRIELATDRTMEFIHMKDMRAAGLEPVDVISKYKWQDGLGYYQSTKDAATHFFFDRIRKGVYVFEYDVRVSHKGTFSNGITNIESMYAPEFSSHSKGIKIEVE